MKLSWQDVKAHVKDIYQIYCTVSYKTFFALVITFFHVEGWWIFLGSRLLEDDDKKIWEMILCYVESSNRDVTKSCWFSVRAVESSLLQLLKVNCAI